MTRHAVGAVGSFPFCQEQLVGWLRKDLESSMISEFQQGRSSKFYWVDVTLSSIRSDHMELSSLLNISNNSQLIRKKIGY